MTLDADLVVELDGFRLDLSMRVDGGRVLALVGPNGAGKTTTLRAIAGLQPLSEGCISIDGRTVDAPASSTFVVPERRSVGVVFQDYLLFPHLSARENVAFGLRARGTGKRAALTAADRWLDRFGVGDRSSAKPARLSGGQAQRVALARALAIDPDVLLLDEPLSALDAAAREDVRRDLGHHLDAFAGVVVLVSHDPIDAAVLADEIAIVEHGRLTQRGPVAEVLAHPSSRYVADLVGVNLLEGRADGHAVDVDGGGRVVLADPMQGRVDLVIEPRAVALSTAAVTTSARNRWRCTVASVEAVGDRARVRLTGEISLVAEVTTASVAELGLRAGAEVWAAVKATEVRASLR